jgi:hypothetical protein
VPPRREDRLYGDGVLERISIDGFVSARGARRSQRCLLDTERSGEHEQQSSRARESTPHDSNLVGQLLRRGVKNVSAA